MINLLGLKFSIVAFLGILFAFTLTCGAIAKLNHLLPRDMGRAFAHDGKLSAGKPRGAGIIFVFTFAISALLFAQMNVCHLVGNVFCHCGNLLRHQRIICH